MNQLTGSRMNLCAKYSLDNQAGETNIQGISISVAVCPSQLANGAEFESVTRLLVPPP